MRQSRVVLFFGSFNPIHIGHTAIANYICEYEEVDELWFVVSPQNPFKEKDNLLNNEIRIDLAKTATRGYQKISICDIEMNMPTPSYTYDTLMALEKKYPQKNFIILIGSDNWFGFSKWKNYEYILSNYELMIYPRKTHKISDKDIEGYQNVKIINAPEIEVSSTFIRGAIEKGKDIRFFLDKGVWKKLSNKK